ncbi:AAA family ATPase [Bosea sp. PAMC 26642]|uniref:AAA family ATPase n=1 Tax=Bosea sp. (strain PAMC 26642) TaxID=1792307 RepID=UPI00076FE608|nr:AAA family ATPase [Bosea sp. PAMC 26642]AMJ59927.1 hypothetical protein AXW83_06130 [Bosea sp. PAMC 26642]
MTISTSGSDDGPISANQLKARSFAPLKFVVEGLVPTGLTVLAGEPKAKKSWLALDIALSVARGEACLDKRKNLCPKGAVLYLALEDSQRRIKDRIALMLGGSQEWPANLFFETDWPRMDADGLLRIRRWIEGTPEARLVIIDVFQKVRSRAGGRGGYNKDYDDITELQKLAMEKEIGILLIHHLRKSGGDPFDRITGSSGFQGASDTLIVLDRGRGGTRLLARGRDIEEIAQELAFDDLAKHWRLAQPRAVVSTHPERDRIVQLLAASRTPLSSRDIEKATGQTNDAVRQLLKKMVDAGEIARVARGHYVSQTANAAWPATGDHSNHNDHNAHVVNFAYDKDLKERERRESWASDAPDYPEDDNATDRMAIVYEALDKLA